MVLVYVGYCLYVYGMYSGYFFRLLCFPGGPGPDSNVPKAVLPKGVGAD